jgi:hypothetical protein
MKKVLLSSFLFCTIAFAQNSSILPDSVDGWDTAGSPEIYIGEDLYRLIDGGADIFHEYGFNKVTTQTFTGSNNRIISVEIYEMNDSSSAFGIFSLFTFSTGKPIEFNCDAYAGNEFLLFQKGKFYVSFSGMESSEETRKGFIQIAKKIERNIPSSDKPYLVNKFSMLKHSRIAYLKGNLGLYNLSNIDFGRNLKIEEGVCFKKINSINFILMYKDEEECGRNILALIDNLKNKSGCEFRDTGSTSYFFKDPEGKHFLISRKMNFILISISTDPLKAAAAVEEIKQIIE